MSISAALLITLSGVVRFISRSVETRRAGASSQTPKQERKYEMGKLIKIKAN